MRSMDCIWGRKESDKTEPLSLHYVGKQISSMYKTDAYKYNVNALKYYDGLRLSKMKSIDK